MYLIGGSWILIAAAVIPAAILLKYIYNTDKLDRESPRILTGLVFAGIISTLIAIAGEEAGTFILERIFGDTESTAYNLCLYFIVVGVSEEGGKYIMLKKRTWHSPEFNCQFDGVVYATFVSLGFALWENIEYVMMFGLHTAMVRAITAVPGHCCFGVFMGVFYGLAKRNANYGHPMKSKMCRILALVVPVLIHGTYDFVCTMKTGNSSLLFLCFIAVVFLASFRLVRNMADHDRFIDIQDNYFPWIK